MATGIESEQVDIERMVKETGISEDKIRDVLDPLDPEIREVIEATTTIEEIKEAYYETPFGGKAEQAVFAKWIEAATTVEEIKEVYDEAPEGSEALRAAIRKLATFFQKKK